MSEPPVVDVRELAKHYGELAAVAGVSFSVRPGEVFGFLGPNGAGKTTTVRMLCTLTRPTAGTATVAGHDIRREQPAVRRAIGIIFQEPTLDDRLTARENLRFHAMIYKVARAEREARIGRSLEWMELSDRGDDLVRNFSGGMKRRLEIARGLLHSPRVFFLDEPTLGLDPQTRRRIWDHLLRLRAEQGMTLFLTTHYMDEAEYCDRIAVIDHGRIIALDTPANLKAQVRGDRVRIETADDARAAAELAERFGVAATAGPEGLAFEVPQGAQFVPRLLRELAVPVRSVVVRPPTLDDVFLKLTGREIRDDGASGADKLKSRLRRMGRAWR